MGVSRSVLFTTSLYALKNNLDFEEAYKLIKTKIPQGYPESRLFSDVQKVTEELKCCL